VRLILRRLVQLVLVLLLVTFGSFLLIKARGSDPTDSIIPFGTPEQKAALREDLGLEKPLYEQYWDWLTGFVTGDLGRSYDTQRPVSELVGDALPVSLQLMVYAQLLALIVAIPLGVLSAYRSGTVTDRGINAGAFAFLAIPNFVLGLVLTYYIGAKYKLLPAGGYVKFGDDPVEHIRSMILPTIALAAGQIAIYMRLLRSDMIATLQENFITMARAKGITSRRILWRHALRPSSLTLLTVAGLNVGTLIGGAVVIEVIFSLPGIGLLLYQAITQSQFVMLQSLVALIAIFYVVLNFLVDFLYAVLDPRIRNERAAA
jgi:peptide/nickel transport system permease protein